MFTLNIYLFKVLFLNFHSKETFLDAIMETLRSYLLQLNAIVYSLTMCLIYNSRLLISNFKNVYKQEVKCRLFTLRFIDCLQVETKSNFREFIKLSVHGVQFPLQVRVTLLV